MGICCLINFFERRFLR